MKNETEPNRRDSVSLALFTARCGGAVVRVHTKTGSAGRFGPRTGPIRLGNRSTYL